MTRNHILAIAALALTTLALAACGSDTDSSSTAADTDATSTASTESSTAASSDGGPGGTVRIEADPNGDLAFTETEIDAPAGQDTIEFDNPSTVGHNVEIEDSSGEDVAETDTITDGETSTTADLQPGTYTFYCGVPGHREAGMEGTLTVK